MSEQKVQLVDWLDDLCVRFVINLPKEELESVERICFQVEEAQWFYEDFIRPLDPSLPSMNLRKFCMVIFQHCPIFKDFSLSEHLAAFSEFLAYKTRVPVRGAIMLNDSMDHIVLVKGWKKGARWSFPRGKINKDESDLDCAIREVYEETGFDLKAAGLAEDEEQVKSIEVSMREQHMRLFVFRGVPLDTYFEPRTRKEISKIEWYRLSDLPTLKQVRQHQTVPGGDEIYQSNKFYMVAPFLGPLKQWIRQQRKRDKLGISAATVAGMPTEDDRIVDKAVSDVAAVVAREQTAASEKAAINGGGHFDNLLAGLRASSQSAEPSPIPLPPKVDPAAALKKMLSVQQTPTSALSPQPPAPGLMEANPLVAMLRKNSVASPSPVQLPATPLEQVPPKVSEPRTPPHHNHIRPPPQNLPIGRPPSFPISPPDATYLSPQNKFQRPSISPEAHRSNNPSALLNLFRNSAREDSIAPEVSSSYFPRQGDPSPTQPVIQQRGVTVPHASTLPAPRLNAHTMSLLNAFKSPTQGPVASVPSLQPQVSELGATSPVERRPSKPAVPAIHSSATENILRLTPKANAAQQNSLLNIFRSPPAGDRPAHIRHLSVNQQPVELAAQPSPHPSESLPPPDFVKPALGVQTTALPQLPGRHSGLTSATVTGPLHSPAFEALHRQQIHPVELNGHGITHVEAEASHRPPLDVAEPKWPPPSANAPEVTRQVEAPKPVSFSILQRPAVLSNTNTMTPTSSPFDNRGSVAQEQQAALLSLFTKPSPQPDATQAAGAGLRVSKPPSGVMSPVSPLPGSGKSMQHSPAGADARSRISSIASLGSGTPMAGIAPTTAPAEVTDSRKSPVGTGPAGGKALGSPSTPVDKNVLLGFLQDVVKGAGR